MNRRFAIVTLVVLILVAGLWWTLSRSHGPETAEAKPIVRVGLITLQAQPISQWVEGFGVIESAPGTEQVRAAPFDCIVSNVYVAIGAQVAAGEVLVEIVPSADSKLLLDSAHSALIVADKALAAAQERFDLKLATQQDLIVARQGKADARAKVLSLENRGLGGATKLRAGTDGVVTKLDAVSGSLSLLGAPLVSIATTRGLAARVAVESSDRLVLMPGQVVTLTSTDQPQAESVTARVLSVGAALNAMTGSLEVRIAVPRTGALLLNEHVRALIEVKKVAAALVVPRSAVLLDEGRTVLFTVKDGKAARHEVATGIANADRVEVQGADLVAGDRVVVTGNYELADNMAIQVDVPADKEP